jgi:hypothetical protein
MSGSYNYDNNNHWKKCSSCDYTASKSSHSLNLEAVETGHRSECKYCDYKGTISSHNYTYWEISSDPSCVEEGIRVRDCKDCGHHVTEVIPVIDHEYAVEIVEGYRKYTCTMCGRTYQEAIETDTTETEPIESDTIENEPVEPDTTETEPIESDTTETEPVEPDTTETEPIESDTIETEPVEPDTIPAETAPGDAESFYYEAMNFIKSVWLEIKTFFLNLSRPAQIVLGGAFAFLLLLAIIRPRRRRR